MVRRRVSSAVRRVRRVSSGFGKVRRSFGGRGMFSGLMGSALSGLLGGLAAQVGNRYLGSYGTPLGYGVAGYMTKNDTLMTMAGIGASAIIPVGSFLGGSSNGNGGAI